MTDCIFCKIIKNEIPAQKVAENDKLLVIKDITPKAPVHYLIIPKKHLESLHSFEQSDIELAGAMMLMAKELSKNLSGTQAFRIVLNNGFDAGQRVFHTHVHFLAGKQMVD